MRGARKVALAVPALIAAAACLPRRDNPFDPSHAPHAQLIVRQPDDCTTWNPAATYPAIASAPHGHCIELDASASADPQSGTSGLSYRFTRIGDSAPLATGASPVALVLGSYLRPLPLGNVTFRVDVADSSGDVGFTETTVQLTNTKPVAKTDPPRTFPEWGFPWAFEVPFTVDFHGSGSDPDGDAITAYCWRLPSDAPEVCGADPTIPNQSIDTMAIGRTVARLTVKDALGAESDPVDAIVEISEPNLWVGGYPNANDPAGIARLDQDRQIAGGTVTQLIPVPNAFIQGNLAMIDIGTSALELVGQDGNVLSPSGSVPNVPDAMEMDPDDTIRVLSKMYGTGQRDVQTWSAASGLLVADAQHPTVVVVTSAAEDVFASEVQPGSPQSLPGGFIAFDGTQIWYGTNEGKHVWIAATDGSAIGADALPPGTALTGLSQRPGTADIWAVEGQAPSDPQFGSIALVRYRWNGTLQRQAWPLGVPDAHGVVWGDADHFWTYRDGIGVCRFDADALEAAAPDVVPGAVDSCTPATSFGIPGGATPSGGSWWQNAEFATLLESDPAVAGVMTPSHALVQARTQFFDWSIQPTPSLTNQPIVRSRTAAYDGAMFRDQNTTPQTRPDWWGGGFWEVDTIPPRLRRRAEDGTVIDEIDRLRLPNGLDVPMRQMIALTSDSAGLWAYEAFDTSAFKPYIARIDLRNRPATDEAALAFEKPTGFFIDAFPGTVFEARKIGSPGVWGESVPLFGGAPTLQLMDATGTATAVFTVPVAETTSVFASVDEYDGSLFLATISSGPTLHVRRFSSTGTLLTTYPTISLAANTVLKDMKVSVDEGVATIFTVTEVPSATPGAPPTATVIAYDLNLTARNTFSEQGPSVLSVAGETRDEIWILRSGPATFGTPERISFFGSSAPPSADLLGTGDVLQYFLVP